MSVRRAQREISSAEFAEWMAYAALEPFGPIREDHRAGVVASIIANVNRDSSSHPEPFTVDEFFPRYETITEELPLSEDDKLKSKLMTWAVSLADNPTSDESKSGLKEKKRRGGHKVQEGEASGDGVADSLSQ